MSVATSLRRDQLLELDRRLTRVAAAAKVGVGIAFDWPYLWLSEWDDLGVPVVERVLGAARDRTLPLVAGHLADVVEAESGWRPPLADLSFDPGDYPAAGARDFRAVARLARDRVLGDLRDGMDVEAAVAKERRVWEGRAVAEPFRLCRQAIKDVTTDPQDPLWRGWARIAEAGACDFCRMLATRGAVYTSATAGIDTKFHAHCRCTATPVIDPQARAQLKADGQAAWAKMKEGQPSGPGTWPALDTAGLAAEEHLELALTGANPKYAQGAQYRENCTRCVIAFEARMRGHDVTAAPLLGGANSRQVAQAAFGIDPAEWKPNSDLFPAAASSGDGARFLVRFNWTDDTTVGHVLIGQVRNGQLVFLDPQNGTAVDIAGQVENLRWVRVDNRDLLPAAGQYFE